MPLAKKKRQEIVKLLQEGKLSKRAIHRKTGVTRTTIDRIEHELLYPEKKLPPPPPKPEKDAPVIYVECSGCHKQVIKNTPCMVCFVRKKQIHDYNEFMKGLVG